MGILKCLAYWRASKSLPFSSPWQTLDSRVPRSFKNRSIIQCSYPCPAQTSRTDPRTRKLIPKAYYRSLPRSRVTPRKGKHWFCQTLINICLTVNPAPMQSTIDLDIAQARDVPD